MAKAIFAYDAMAAERVLGSSLKLLAFLFTVVFIIQDNVTDTGNMVIIGIYRPLRPMCGEYQPLLENQLSEICN